MKKDLLEYNSFFNLSVKILNWNSVRHWICKLKIAGLSMPMRLAVWLAGSTEETIKHFLLALKSGH